MLPPLGLIYGGARSYVFSGTADLNALFELPILGTAAKYASGMTKLENIFLV